MKTIHLQTAAWRSVLGPRQRRTPLEALDTARRMEPLDVRFAVASALEHSSPGPPRAHRTREPAPSARVRRQGQAPQSLWRRNLTI
ncbi:hypothetical protein N9L68_01695 [bacterium]|nr:hypothetical protein [bacterium]